MDMIRRGDAYNLPLKLTDADGKILVPVGTDENGISEIYGVKVKVGMREHLWLNENNPDNGNLSFDEETLCWNVYLPQCETMELIDDAEVSVQVLVNLEPKTVISAPPFPVMVGESTITSRFR